MNITSAQYIQNRNSENVGVYATIDGIEMSVPMEPANRHYAAILKWEKEDSNTIQEAD